MIYHRLIKRLSMSTPLFTLGLCLLTVTIPFVILSLYRIIVVVVCFLCGTAVDGVVISKQKNAISSCLSLHSTHKLMEKRESNYSNIEVWIAYSVGNFNWQVTMVEMSASSYISFPRGKKVKVKYCRTCCCLRAEPRLTCQRFCGTLVWDRLLDIFLIACVVGGCACCWLSVQTGEDAKLHLLLIPICLTCCCLTCCCHFNLCFLRRNPYKQHVKEVLECDSEPLIGSPQKKMDRRRSSPGRKQTPSKERFAGHPNRSANQNNSKADSKAGSKKVELPLKVEKNSSFGSVATDYSVMLSDRANYFDIEGTEDVELEIFAATDPVE